MPDRSESPSSGWRDVYDRMGADPGAEEPTHRCPDCGRACPNVFRNVYECGTHGVFRTPGEATADDSTGRPRGRAD